MTTTDTPPPVPGRLEVDASIKLIQENAQKIFTWRYDRERPQLVTLYNKANTSQWNSVTDLDWSTDVDPEVAVRSSPQQNVTSSSPAWPPRSRAPRSARGATRSSPSSASRA